MAKTLIERLQYAAEWPPDQESRALFLEAADALAQRYVPRAEPVAWLVRGLGNYDHRQFCTYWEDEAREYHAKERNTELVPLYVAPQERSDAQRDDNNGDKPCE